jgi:mandelate racemase
MRSQPLVLAKKNRFRPTTASAWPGPDGAAQEAAESIELGFRGVKFKVGYPRVERDRAVIRAARGYGWQGFTGHGDYNQGLSAPEAIGRVQLLEEEALVRVKEPTRPDDFAGHAPNCRRMTRSHSASRNLWGPRHLTKSLSVGASDFVMLDVMKIGGITGQLRAVTRYNPGP